MSDGNYKTDITNVFLNVIFVSLPKSFFAKIKIFLACGFQHLVLVHWLCWVKNSEINFTHPSLRYHWRPLLYRQDCQIFWDLNLTHCSAFLVSILIGLLNQFSSGQNNIEYLFFFFSSLLMHRERCTVSNVTNLSVSTRPSPLQWRWLLPVRCPWDPDLPSQFSAMAILAGHADASNHPAHLRPGDYGCQNLQAYRQRDPGKRDAFSEGPWTVAAHRFFSEFPCWWWNPTTGRCRYAEDIFSRRYQFSFLRSSSVPMSPISKEALEPHMRRTVGVLSWGLYGFARYFPPSHRTRYEQYEQTPFVFGPPDCCCRTRGLAQHRIPRSWKIRSYSEGRKWYHRIGGVKLNSEFSTIITSDPEQRAWLLQGVENHRQQYPDFGK